MGVSVSETNAETQNGDGQRDGKFAEKAADDIAHE